MCVVSFQLNKYSYSKLLRLFMLTLRQVYLFLVNKIYLLLINFLFKYSQKINLHLYLKNTKMKHYIFICNKFFIR